MPRRQPGRRPVRPSLLLWRWRHLVIAACVAGASLLVLSFLHPPATEEGREVLVLARDVPAGQALEETDLESRSLPEAAVPGSDLADGTVVGTRAAVALREGTVLTRSMTSGADAVGLDAREQLVQVPVEVGAGLAQPGARVDVVGEVGVVTAGAATASQERTPAEAEAAEEGGPTEGATGLDGAGAADAGAPVLSTQDDHVLTTGARVIRVEPVEETSQLRAGSKVTLVTLAVARDDASLVVAAATHESLGLIMSPS